MIDHISLKNIKTNTGADLWGLSHTAPVMLVFLRHFGCIFCKEALTELSKRTEIFKLQSISLVCVHMTDNETAEGYFTEYGLKDVMHISDPDCAVYKKFGLVKGNFKQLFGLQNWKKGFELHVKGVAVAGFKQIGDGFQMPGIFLIDQGEIKDKFVHEFAGDVPDYDDLVKCCVKTAQ